MNIEDNDSIPVMEDRWMDGIPNPSIQPPTNMTDDVILVMVRGYGIQGVPDPENIFWIHFRVPDQPLLLLWLS
jgi:hypothetical protein